MISKTLLALATVIAALAGGMGVESASGGDNINPGQPRIIGSAYVDSRASRGSQSQRAGDVDLGVKSRPVPDGSRAMGGRGMRGIGRRR
jgi:hypothetical protein